MSSWAKLWTLSFPEKRLLAASVMLLPISAVALRFIGLRRWQTFLSKGIGRNRSQGSCLDKQALDAAYETARMVRVASSRGPYRGNCLQQSVTLWWLLQRQSIESKIRFGARKDGGRLEAHAWVEVDGCALNEGRGGHNEFKPCDRVSTDRRETGERNCRHNKY